MQSVLCMYVCVCGVRYGIVCVVLIVASCMLGETDALIYDTYDTTHTAQHIHTPTSGHTSAGNPPTSGRSFHVLGLNHEWV